MSPVPLDMIKRQAGAWRSQAAQLRLLSVYHLHCVFLIPFARGNSRWGNSIQHFKLLRIQLEIEGTQVLIQITSTLCPRNREDIFALSKHPRERELCEWPIQFERD